MTSPTPVGTLNDRDRHQQNALDQTELSRRLVTIAAIRAEASDNPSLTPAQCTMLLTASDVAILEAIDSEARAIEDRLYALHDELQSLVVNQIAAA